MSPSSLAIKGLLFDKDGTLFDYQTTWGPWASGFIADLSKGDPHLSDVIAGALEFDLKTGTFRPQSHFIAGTTDQVLAIILDVIPDINAHTLEKFYCESTEKADLAPPVPLVPLLEGFARGGIKLGVATNDHETAALGQLKKAGIDGHFDFIAGYDSGFGAKPEPGMQNAFCAKVGLIPGQVAMVGDSTHDLEAGRNAGMVTIGVLTGMALREELSPMATVVLNHIGEIPDWLSS